MRTFLVFICGTELPGEPDHALVEKGTSRGPAVTAPCYDLVDIGRSAALIEGGLTAVHGELYELQPAQLAAIDVLREHPVFYRRQTIRLADGRSAEAYFLNADQVRGKRRVRSGEWRTRNDKPRASDGGPLVQWARRRHLKPGG